MHEATPAQVQTVRLIGLSMRRRSADSAAIEDIPSSMQPEGTPS
jgi:hypothetical protein